ncbi:hypothetical protein [Ensifer sp. LCM 4579]|uniref:hypothetical protein n=1 Tax=Ensifer sp. LCM 4579 TaxID=1848292 RepID=UPI001FCDC994|nr:hypothetical protein [Ensifer sp. LCM 4579]
MECHITKILLFYVLRQEVEEGEYLCTWKQLAQAREDTLPTAEIRAPIMYDGDPCVVIHRGERKFRRNAPVRVFQASNRCQFVPARMMHMEIPLDRDGATASFRTQEDARTITAPHVLPDAQRSLFKSARRAFRKSVPIS